MKNKNISDVLNKVRNKTNDSMVTTECSVWISRINDGSAKDYIRSESKMQKEIMEKIPITYNIRSENINFDGLCYTYMEIKTMIIIRRFVEILMNK